MKYYIYKFVGDERWDMLAWLYYGDAGRIAPLVEANPHIPIEVKLPSVGYLRIPVLEGEGGNDISGTLPPWKR